MKINLDINGGTKQNWNEYKLERVPVEFIAEGSTAKDLETEFPLKAPGTTTFAGWADITEDPDSEDILSPNEPILADHTYKAIFATDLTIEYRNADGSTAKRQTVKKGEQVFPERFFPYSKTNGPAISDATYFRGWADARNPDEILSTFIAKEDTVLVPVTGKIMYLTFHANGGTFQNTADPETIEVLTKPETTLGSAIKDYQREVGDTYALIPKSNDGRRFLGWATYYNNKTTINEDYYVSSGEEFWAVYSDEVILTIDYNGKKLYGNPYTIQKAMPGQYFEPAIDVYADQEMNAGSNTDTNTGTNTDTSTETNLDPNTYHYKLIGYSKNPEATEPDLPLWQGKYLLMEEDVTIYAIWQPVYAITFDYNGGTADNNTEVTDYVAVGESPIASPYWTKHPTKDGAAFDHWESAGQPGTNLHLLATYTPDVCKVTFDLTADNTFWNGSTTQTYYVKRGERLPQQPPTVPYHNGKDFDYWMDADGNETTTYLDPITADVTYTAHYEDVQPKPEEKTVYITFDSNDGRFSTGERVIYSAAADGSFFNETDFADLEPIQSGVLFDGWCLDKEGQTSAEGTEIHAGLRVYAKWILRAELDLNLGDGYVQKYEYTAGNSNSAHTLTVYGKPGSYLDWNTVAGDIYAPPGMYLDHFKDFYGNTVGLAMVNRTDGIVFPNDMSTRNQKQEIQLRFPTRPGNQELWAVWKPLRTHTIKVVSLGHACASPDAVTTYGAEYEWTSHTFKVPWYESFSIHDADDCGTMVIEGIYFDEACTNRLTMHRSVAYQATEAAVELDYDCTIYVNWRPGVDCIFKYPEGSFTINGMARHETELRVAAGTQLGMVYTYNDTDGRVFGWSTLTNATEDQVLPPDTPVQRGETYYAVFHKKHVWDAGTVTRAATTTSTGTRTYTCTICGETKTAGIAMKVMCNVSSLPMQVGQTCSKVTATTTAGDFIKSWTSSNTSIVKVTGLVGTGTTGTTTACKLVAQAMTGTAKITVKTNQGKIGTFYVKVQTGKVATTSLKLTAPKPTNTSGTASKLTMVKGFTYTIKVARTPFTANDAIKYTTNNSSVVTGTTTGILKAVANGTATITIKAGTKTATVAVNVKSSLNFNVSSLLMQKKQVCKEVKVTMQSGDYVTAWKSSNTAVVKVTGGTGSTNGKVGTCVITAMSPAAASTYAYVSCTLRSGLTKKIKVTVQTAKVPTSALKLTAPKPSTGTPSLAYLSLAKGKYYPIKTTRTPLTVQDTVTYKSSNTAVATVSSKGTIKAIKAGTATITVTSGTKKVYVKVTVK